MKANVYVDGFNLYYGAVKGTPYRWLDIAAMCRLLLPHDQINQIKYFTALINPRPQDPDQPTRQQTYLRALRTIPNLAIILGHFLTHDVMMPLAPPANGYVKVTKTEEKGSDVNLATHLLVDGYHGDYEIAVIVSNDSDLLAPIQVVTQEFKKPVGLLNPQKHPSHALLPHIAFIKQIRSGVLAKKPISDNSERQARQFFETGGVVMKGTLYVQLPRPLRIRAGSISRTRTPSEQLHVTLSPARLRSLLVSTYAPPPLPDPEVLPDPGPLPPGFRIPFQRNALFTGRVEALKTAGGRNWRTR